jgi:hypothetical protein
MDERPNTRTLHKELVEHLVRSMEHEGLTIDAADAPGYRKPGNVKSGRRRARFRPDVVARDGRRTIFGVVKSEAEARDGQLRDQLETFAGKCRMVVICIPEEAARQTVDALFQNADMPHWRKMRLLRHPDTKWQEAPRPAKGRPPSTMPDVKVVIEGP